MTTSIILPALTDPDSSLRETLTTLEQREFANRRRLLRGLGSALLFAPVSSWACTLIPTETAGPYPGDGSNGPNVLTQSGIVRSDIRSSFGASGTTVATGTPMTVTLQLVSTNGNSCAPLAGLAVYIWHCDRSGLYSMYSSGVTGQNYLRGVQISDSQGRVTFTTIFPAAYSGRWPHMHFEVYTSVAQAVAGANAIATSQLALPESVCREVFAQTAIYPSSLNNLNQITLASDNVFGNDRAATQLAAVTGSIAAGYAATLEVGIAATATASTAPDINQQGLTGVWYEPTSSGQGIALEVFPDLNGTGVGYLQAGWFTYDIAPAGGVERQRWYTFGGAVSAGSSTASLPIYRNTGGNFNAGPITTAQAVGTAIVSFTSCTAGQLQYSFTDGRSGTIPITRITPSVTCSTTTARPTNADASYSGNWYSPSTAGQGFVIEMNPYVPVVCFGWFTYAVNGQNLGVAGQRWFTGQGAYTTGTRQSVVTLYETVGGIFDENTPAAQVTNAVGTATITFANCTNATLVYNFTSGSNAGQSGTIVLSRNQATAGCV